MQSPQNTTSSYKTISLFWTAGEAKHFNEFFSQQCKPIANSSVLPNITFLPDKRIDKVTIGTMKLIL